MTGVLAADAERFARFEREAKALAGTAETARQRACSRCGAPQGT